MRLEVVPFAGRPRNLRLSNAHVDVIATLDVGPVVLWYGPRGGPNAFQVLPETPGEGWRPRGGHRLWVAPEDPIRTYVADDAPVAVEEVPGGARLTAPPDPSFGLEKGLELTLDGGGGVRVVHRIRNTGQASQRLAAWALTVVAARSVAWIPLPPAGIHPGRTARSARDFAPALTLALWPWFRFGDPRLDLAPDRLLLRHDPGATGPTKLGLSLREGRVAAFHQGWWFVKRFPWDDAAAYPDGGVNFETYTDADLLELETLSPLEALAPGETLEHTEWWGLVEGTLDRGP